MLVGCLLILHENSFMMVKNIKPKVYLLHVLIVYSFMLVFVETVWKCSNIALFSCIFIGHMTKQTFAE